MTYFMHFHNGFASENIGCTSLPMDPIQQKIGLVDVCIRCHMELKLPEIGQFCHPGTNL